jgi:hypothetical protein
MAKRQSFADKASKVKHSVSCPTCGTALTPTLFLIPTKASNGAYKYKKTMVDICKCNHKEYYG